MENEKTQAPQITAEHILERIDYITKDSAYLKEAFMTIEKIPYSQEAAPQAGSRCEAIASIVRDREETNRKVVELLEKMYDDLKEKSPSPYFD